MSKGNPKKGKKDALLENVKEVIGDAAVVNNEANRIQIDVPPIEWVVMDGEYQGIVEDVIYFFLHLPTWKIYQHRGSIVYFKVCYIFSKQIFIVLHCYFLSNI